MYVLKRVPDGAYVAPAGRAHSYVKCLQDAQTFATREQAERGKCGNEVVCDVENELHSPRY